MSAPISDDGNDSEHSTYAPKRFGEQPRMPAAAQLYAKSAPTVPSSTNVDQDRLTRPEFASWAESISAATTTTGGGLTMALIGRIAVVVAFAAVVALLTVFAKPLWEGVDPRPYQLPNHLTDLQRIKRRRITHSFQPQPLQRPLARSRLRERRRSKRRSHRTRKNRGAPFGG